MYGSNFWSTTLYPRLLSSIPSAAALVPLPMDDTTPPVTKIYLVSLIHTPRKRTNAPTFTNSRKGEENPAVRRGIIASRKPLLRHTCMDLYHTTSGARMKPEITQHYSTRRHLAYSTVAILPSPPSGACLDAATERRAQAAWFPSRPLQAPHSNRPGPSRYAAWRRTLRESFSRHTSCGRSVCL